MVAVIIKLNLIVPLPWCVLFEFALLDTHIHMCLITDNYVQLRVHVHMCNLAEEIVRKINLILEGLPGGGAKFEYSEQQLRGRKGTKTTPLT